MTRTQLGLSRSLLILSMLVASLSLTTGTAFAADSLCYSDSVGGICHEQPTHWYEGRAIGASPCQNISGGYVKSLQYVLYNSGDLTSTLAIDGYFGPTTTAALKAWQTRYGLGADACAGYNTWYKMQYGSSSYKDLDTGSYVTVPFMQYLGTFTAPNSLVGKKWRNQNSRTSRTSSYYNIPIYYGLWILNNYVPPANPAGSCVATGFYACAVY